MAAHRTRQRWTYAEFARLPREGARRHEIIDAELVVTPAPALRHQRVVTRLVSILHAFVESHDLGEVFAGPVDVLFAEGDYLEPDVVFVRAGRSEVLTDRGVEGAPDLVVEVTSPSTAARDRGVKLERYRRYGVAEYWVVDADRDTIDVWYLVRDAHKPVTFGPPDTLRWVPGAGDVALEISVAEVVATK